MGLLITIVVIAGFGTGIFYIVCYLGIRRKNKETETARKITLISFSVAIIATALLVWYLTPFQFPYVIPDDCSLTIVTNSGMTEVMDKAIINDFISELKEQKLSREFFSYPGIAVDGTAIKADSFFLVTMNGDNYTQEYCFYYEKPDNSRLVFTLPGKNHQNKLKLSDSKELMEILKKYK